MEAEAEEEAEATGGGTFCWRRRRVFHFIRSRRWRCQLRKRLPQLRAVEAEAEGVGGDIFCWRQRRGFILLGGEVKAPFGKAASTALIYTCTTIAGFALL